VDRRKTTTIRNAIDVERFGAGDPAVARRVLGLPDDAALVLFCSRLDPQKRPVEAVEAFGQVAEEFPRAHLVCVGSGSEEGRVMARAADLGISSRVHLAGYRTDVPDWLAAATVWLLPTERENFSVALLEALAAGCPVVTTDCPGNDEVLVHGENAITFTVGDVNGAANGLRQLLADPVLRERLSAAGRRTASQHSASAMVANVGALYRRLVPDLAR
jgi:glycosyltransferase involved in cell wall biosynthesis